MVTPMQPIRIALVGVGRIADLHAQAYTHDPRATLWALCDRDEELLARRADEWGVERTFTDYADLLADPDVQAVEILTPTSLHCEQVLAAAAAGKHISVQKPMALSMEDGRRMVDACERAGVVYKVCENYVFYPPLQRARVQIDGGAIGRVLSVGMRMVGAGSGGWPVAADSWRWRLEEAKVAGGPTVFDHGHHMYSCGWYLGGRIDKLHAWIHHVDAVVDSPATVQWAYEDGLAQGSVQFVMCPELEVESPYYSNDEWFEIAGTRGLIWVNSCTAEFRPGLPAVTLQTSDGVQHIDDLDSDWAAGFTGALRNFVDAIYRIEPPLLSGEEGLEILAVDLAIQRSQRLQRPVYVDELRRPDGSAVHRRRHRQDVRAQRPDRPPFWARLFGSDDRHAPRCRELTEGLVERFDGGEVADWQATICVDAQGEHGGQWTFAFADGQMEMREGLDPAAELTVAMPAGTWAAILAGDKKIESAFLQGKLQIDGKPETALPLRKAFGL